MHLSVLPHFPQKNKNVGSPNILDKSMPEFFLLFQMLKMMHQRCVAD